MPEENVKVAVRVRPFNSREKNRNAELIIEMTGPTTKIRDPTGANEDKKFTFDYSYWSHDGCKEESNGYFAPNTSKFADQKKVYNELGHSVLTNAWEGYNSTLFAYGQTGSGKSWSMVGYGINKGIVPLLCEQIFSQIEERKAEGTKDEYEVTFSMLEIYNESVRDLLDSKTRKGGLRVRQHPKHGFYPDGLQVIPVGSYAEIEKKMEEGTTNRTVASTNMNATSSRAHTIVGITFVQKSLNAAGEEMAKSAVVNLVDLAGSERAESTGATGDRLKEGAAINQSLSCLGNCIAALADRASGKQTRVPYRDSVLTKLLKNALGGNSKTVMIAALSPADINYDETLSTLRYADRAKQIKTTATVNEDPTEKLIRELQEENDKLKAMLAAGGKMEMKLDDDDEEDDMSDAEREAEYQRLVEKNQQEMEEMRKTFEQKLAEAGAKGGVTTDFAEIAEKKKKVPHIYNLNLDPQLTGHIIKFIELTAEDPELTIGTKKAEATDVGLVGPSIAPTHCTIRSEEGGKITLTPEGTARTLRNGKQVTEKVVLKHNDRLIFGTTQYFVFCNPQERDISKEKYPEVTFQMAQEEIASKSGFDVSGKNKSKDDLILQEDLLEVIPAIQEANAISEELDKRKKFELVIVSPEARGDLDGRTEVMVKVMDMDTRHEWMWDRQKFLKRKFIMREMFNNYEEGEEWQKPPDQDPFVDDMKADYHIGTVVIWLKSLAYKTNSKEQLTITDYKGQGIGKLSYEIVICDGKGKEVADDTDCMVDDPKELVGKELHFKIKLASANGLPEKFTDIHGKYKLYLDENSITTKCVANTSNPEWKFEKVHSFPTVTEQLVEFLDNKAFCVLIMGKQKDHIPKKGKGAGLKHRQSVLTGTTVNAANTNVKHVDPETVKCKMEIAALKKKQEKMEMKMEKLKRMLAVAEENKKRRLSVKIIHGVYYAPTADMADKCIALIPGDKDEDTDSSSSSSSSSDEEKKKAVAVVAPTKKSEDKIKEERKEREKQKGGSAGKQETSSETKLTRPTPAPRKKSAKSDKGSQKGSSSCMLL